MRMFALSQSAVAISSPYPDIQINAEEMRLSNPVLIPVYPMPISKYFPWYILHDFL